MNIGIKATYIPTVTPMPNLKTNRTYISVYIVMIVNIIDSKHVLNIIFLSMNRDGTWGLCF